MGTIFVKGHYFIQMAKFMRERSTKDNDKVGGSILILMVKFIMANGEMMRNLGLGSIFLNKRNYFQGIGVIIIHFMVSIKFKVYS